MKLSPSQKRNFVIVDTNSNSIKQYITYKIPAKYRTFAEVWHVHESYIPVILKFVEGSGLGVDTSDLPGYNLSSGSAYRALFLTEDAPDFIVKAVWKALASQYHPDAPSGNSDLFMKFKLAYDELKGK